MPSAMLGRLLDYAGPTSWRSCASSAQAWTRPVLAFDYQTHHFVGFYCKPISCCLYKFQVLFVSVLLE